MVGQAVAARRAWASWHSGMSPGNQDRVAPVVEGDAFGEQLGAEAVAVAGDHVDDEMERHRRRSWWAGTGRNGRRTHSAQGPWRWWATWAAKTSRALATKRRAPSGSLQAPRPATIGIQRWRSRLGADGLVCRRRWLRGRRRWPAGRGCTVRIGRPIHRRAIGRRALSRRAGRRRGGGRRRRRSRGRRRRRPGWRDRAGPPPRRRAQPGTEVAADENGAAGTDTGVVEEGAEAHAVGELVDPRPVCGCR